MQGKDAPGLAVREARLRSVLHPRGLPASEFPQVPGCPAPLASCHLRVVIPGFLATLASPLCLVGGETRDPHGIGHVALEQFLGIWGGVLPLHMDHLVSEPPELRLFFATRLLKS